MIFVAVAQTYDYIQGRTLKVAIWEYSMLRTLTMFHLFQYNPLRMTLARSRYDVIADSAHTLFLRTLTNLKFQS